MFKQTYSCRINDKKEIAPGIVEMKAGSREIVEQAKPGQFLNIKCCDGMNALLRRPISICDTDIERQEVRFIFQIKGEGTKLLAAKSVGDYIDILGPLGTPFNLEQKFSKPLLVGGGIGVFPLLMLAKQFAPENTGVYLGFRNKEAVVLEDEFTRVCSELSVATDDGSYGMKGYVTQLLAERLKQGTTDVVYACGPEPMLKLVQKICGTYAVPCQLSLEQRMGCGIGACLVCACKIKTRKGDDWEYKHVCKDGPVFRGDEVIFDA